MKYRYTIKASNFNADMTEEGYIIIIKVKTINEHLALKRAKHIARRTDYNVVEIEEL